MTNVKHFLPQPHEGEAIALKATLLWLKDMDIEEIIIKTNCQLVVNSMNQKRMDH